MSNPTTITLSIPVLTRTDSIYTPASGVPSLTPAQSKTLRELYDGYIANGEVLPQGAFGGTICKLLDDIAAAES